MEKENLKHWQANKEQLHTEKVEGQKKKKFNGERIKQCGRVKKTDSEA